MSVTRPKPPPAWTRRTMCLAGLCNALLPPVAARAQSDAQGTSVQDQRWHDPVRQRDVPVRIRWPQVTAGADPLPVVLFSHGLGGSIEGGSLWGEAWARAGLVVVHLQHPGSDLAGVRAAARSLQDRAGLRGAASPAQLLARLQDCRFVLDQIQQRHARGVDHWARARPVALGMSGHSFGAHTTLGMAGQRFAGFAGVDEPRLAAFIAFSPSLPAAGDAQAAFAPLGRPLLSITGTRDQDVIGNGATPERRQAVFAALPPGGKAHLVLQDADHMTFGGQTDRAAEVIARDPVARERQAVHHATLAAITTDWWLATLRNDGAARARLVAPATLQAGDLWQQK